ncbi:MAG: hypothetical protein ACRD8Z_16980 [Nitrososphaeraceae archaeon]
MSNYLKTVKPGLVTAFSVILVFSLVSVSFLVVTWTQSEGNYAFAQTSILRTTELKVNFEKIVERGNDQTIRVKVNDVGSGDPVSGATAQLTIYFPAGAPIRQFTLITDKNGEASLTLPIDRNAALGQYGIDVIVAALGYFDSTLGTVMFAVNSDVDENVSLKDYKHTSHTISGHSKNHNNHHD